MRVGVFGGSFDPVHNGHLLVAAAAADALGLDEVRFVPARQQPFKAGRHHASPADRRAMLERAVAADPRFRVDDSELRRSGPSYTIDTVRALRDAHPADRLFLLVGADAARDLPGWRAAATLTELVEVIVLTRPGMPATLPAGAQRIVTVPAVDISASAVRERCRRGEPIDHLVPAAVAEYVADRGLYVEGD